MYFQSWDAASQAPVIHDGPNGLVRLDRAISLAEARGVRLILALTNNWQDFGGMSQYVKWLGLPAKHFPHPERGGQGSLPQLGTATN